MGRALRGITPGSVRAGLLWAGALLAGSGCSPESAGVPVGVEDSRPRMVSLVPALTPVIDTLGGPGVLVGASHDDDPHPLDSVVVDVGGVLTPSVERIVALRPTRVWVWEGVDASTLASVLAPDGAVESVSIEDLMDLEAAIRRVGATLGREARAAGMADGLALDRRSRCRWSGDPPAVLWVVGARPVVAAGARTHLGEILEIAGVRNAASTAEGAWPTFGLESLVSIDPDLVVWTGDGPSRRARDELGRIPAVRQGRFVVLEPDAWHVPRVDAPTRARALAIDLADVLNLTSDAVRCPDPKPLPSPSTPPPSGS